MTPASGNTATTAGARAPTSALSPYSRLWRLAQVHRGELHNRSGLRAAAGFAWILAGVTSSAVLVVAGSGALKSLDLVALRGSEAASWFVGGVACFSLARWHAETGTAPASNALLQARGYRSVEQSLARRLGAGWLVARLLLIANVLPWLMTLCAVDGWRLLTTRVQQLLLVTLYFMVLTLALEILARGAARLWPRRPLSALTLLVFGPDLVRSAFPTVPSLPRLAEQALRVIQNLGDLS